MHLTANHMATTFYHKPYYVSIPFFNIFKFHEIHKFYSKTSNIFNSAKIHIGFHRVKPAFDKYGLLSFGEMMKLRKI